MTASNRRYFQFRLRNALLATFWVAVCLGACLAIASLDASQPRREGAIVALLAIAALSPFLAIGSLVGKPIWGFAIGMVVFCFLQAIVIAGMAAGLLPIVP